MALTSDLEKVVKRIEEARSEGEATEQDIDVSIWTVMHDRYLNSREPDLGDALGDAVLLCSVVAQMMNGWSRFRRSQSN